MAFMLQLLNGADIRPTHKRDFVILSWGAGFNKARPCEARKTNLPAVALVEAEGRGEVIFIPLPLGGVRGGCMRMFHGPCFFLWKGLPSPLSLSAFALRASADKLPYKDPP